MEAIAKMKKHKILPFKCRENRGRKKEKVELLEYWKAKFYQRFILRAVVYANFFI